MYADTREGVTQMIRENADQALVDSIEKMVDAETARWIPDPQVPGVWGLEDLRTRAILMVAYTSEGDFETSEHFRLLRASGGSEKKFSEPLPSRTIVR